MSISRRAVSVFRLSCVAVLFGFVTFLVTDNGLSAEQTAPAPSQALEKPASLQHLALGSQPPTGNATPAQTQQAIRAFDLSPAVFVENKGQWDPHVRYAFDGKGTRVSFTDSGPVFQMLKSGGEDAEVSQAVFSATFVGGRKVTPVGIEKSASTTNYYRGNDSSKWQSSVPSFQKVAYLDIYEGVDLYTWGKRSGLKYEFHVAPGASWKQIVVRYDGIDGLSIDDKGALHVRTPLGEIIDSAPVVYQETDRQRVEIAARFALVDKCSYAFEIADAIDPSLPLVIDPDLAWSTYLGGSGSDTGYGITADASGNCYVTGDTDSPDFPTPGGFNTGFGGGDAFVAKLTLSGRLAWVSYLGGSGGGTRGWGIAVDASGNCYVTGDVSSSDFPTPGGFDASFGGWNDAFVAKLTSSGELAWASYLGGSDFDYGRGIAVDALGDCYVTGDTGSPDFPTTGGFDTSLTGDSDAFVAKVTSSGQLAWASYLAVGGNMGRGVAVDASGDCYVTGGTKAFYTMRRVGFDTNLSGACDAFVAKVMSSGQLAWVIYLGGSGYDEGHAIAVAASGDCYVTGFTGSPDFPVPGGFDTTLTGDYDAFVAKVTSSGQLAWASYLGGGGGDVGYGIAVDASGNCYVTGLTFSSDFPTPGGFDTSFNGIEDAFVAKVTSSGQLVWGSYLGGSGYDERDGIAVDASGDCYVTGETDSPHFPTPRGFDTTYNGGGDAFVAKIAGNGLAFWINALHSKSMSGLDSLVLTAPSIAANSDFFGAEIANDRIKLILHAVLNSFSIGIAEARLVGEPVVDWTVSGLVDSGVKTFLKAGEKGLFYVACRVAINKSAVPTVAQSAVLDGFNQLAAKLTGQTVQKVVADGTAATLGAALTAPGFSMTRMTDSFAADVSTWETALDDSHESILSGIPKLTAELEEQYATDLRLRIPVPQVLADATARQRDLLSELRSARNQASRDAWWLLFAKVGLGVGATLAFDGAGALGAAAVNSGIDIWIDSAKIHDDEWGYQLGLGALTELVGSERTVVANELSGFSRIANQLTPETDAGQVGPVSSFSTGIVIPTASVPLWVETSSYSDVRVTNTGTTTTSYLVIAQYRSDAHLFGTVSRYLPLVSEAAAVNIAPGRTTVVRVFYLGHNQRGLSPSADSVIIFDVLANNEKGTFYAGPWATTWNPTYRVTVFGAAARARAPIRASAFETDPITIENPVYVRIAETSDSTYEARIFVTNPFDAAIDAQITQPIPSGITVLTTDGTNTGPTITWTKHVEAASITSVWFTFERSALATGPVVLPPATMTFVEPTSQTEVSIESNAPGGNRPLGLSSLRLTSDFRPVRDDTAVLRATIPADLFPTDFNPSGLVVTLDVGGVSQDFTLDARGKGKSGSSALSLTYRKARGKPVWLCVAKLKLDADVAWADCGLTDETVRDKPVIVPVRLVLNASNPYSFYSESHLYYRATAGQLGSAR